MANAAPLVLQPTADRPTPSTDQLFAVGVSVLNTDDDDDAKYYVAGNSIVVGSTKKKKYQISANGAKRRAKLNPVFSVTADSRVSNTFWGTNNDDFRVYGVAYDGVNTSNMHNAKTHPDSCGRFSVIYAGTATISVPHTGPPDRSEQGYNSRQTGQGGRPATIGDIVVVNPLTTTYNFRGDPDTHRSIGVGYVNRDTWAEMLRDANPTQAYIEAFGIAFDDENMQFANLLKLQLGYVLDTGSATQNEVRVQIDTRMYTGLGVANIVPFAVAEEDDDNNDDVFRGVPLPDLPGIGPGTVGSSFVDCIKSIPDTTPEDGCPEGSLLGVVGAAVAPTGTVGTIDYTTTSAKDAGAIMARASRPVVGLSSTGKATPGTFAGELLNAGQIDANSDEKLAARQALVQGIRSYQVPDMVGPHSSSDISVPVTPTMNTMLGECPSSVIQSHALHNADGSVSAPHPMFVSGLANNGKDTVTSAAPGKSLGIYQDKTKAKTFAPKIGKLLKAAKKSGKSIHLAPQDKLDKFVKACQDELNK